MKPLRALLAIAFLTFGVGPVLGLTPSEFLRTMGGRWLAVAEEGRLSVAGRSTSRIDINVLRTSVASAIFQEAGAGGVLEREPAESHGARYYTFIPVIGGVPVENRELIFAVDRDDFAIGLTMPIGTLKPPVAGPLLDRAEIPDAMTRMALCEFSRDRSPMREPCNPLLEEARDVRIEDVSESFLFARPDGQTVQAYRVKIETVAGVGLSQYVVNARRFPGGTPLEILERRSGLHFCRGPRATIFNPNPPATLGDIRIDRSSPQINGPGVYSRVRLRGLQKTRRGEPVALQGEYVSVTNDIGSMTDQPIPMSVGGAFLGRSGELLFASAMVYHHIDTMQRRVQRLGFRNLIAFPLTVDPQYELAQNSILNSYTETNSDGPRSVRIAFGWIPGQNLFDAEDADVIAHEYAHALQWGAARRKYNSSDEVDYQVAAIAEGFADYWAMVMFDERNRLYENERMRSECYAEWSKRGCVRVVNLGARRRDARPCKTPHDNGSVWTAVLWRIAGGLGDDQANRLVLQSHYGIEDRPNFCGAAMALLRADQALNRGRNWSFLQAVLHGREIFGNGHCRGVSL